MIKYRSLATVTEDEARLLVEKCFDAELVEIREVDDEELLLDVKSQWMHDGEREDMVDTVSFTITRYGTHVSVPWSKVNEEKIFEDFVIYYGFHPSYKDNAFEGEDIASWAKNYKRSAKL